MASPQPRIAIIGAGMAGLSCAQSLNPIADVTVFEKSRGVSGRMSTRYAGAFEFDHGAQYFTAQDPHFITTVDIAVQNGHLAPWSGSALYHKAGEFSPDTGRPRYVGTPRMNSWCKAMAAPLNIYLGGRVEPLIEPGVIQLESGKRYAGFDHIVCAVPSPQAAALLPKNFAHIDAVKQAHMQACFAMMIGFENPDDFNPNWDTLRLNEPPLAWMAINSAKPGRGLAKTLVIHTAPDWSDQYADADRTWIQTQILNAASDFTGYDLSRTPHQNLHRWLYASLARAAHAPHGHLYDPNLRVGVCGDWCQERGRVEGAFLSGRAMADTLQANWQ